MFIGVHSKHSSHGVLEVLERHCAVAAASAVLSAQQGPWDVSNRSEKIARRYRKNGRMVRNIKKNMVLRWT